MLEQGGADSVARQHANGRLTIRERIDRLCDEFHEVGALTGRGEYGDDGTLVGFTPGNIVMGEARIDGRPAVVTGYDLPAKLPPGEAARIDQLVTLMARDKKAVAGHTFVLDGPRGVEVVDRVPRDDVVAALKEIM